MSEKLKVGIVGATGMVGQRLITLLARHPWFEISCLAASARSAGKKYASAVAGRWTQKTVLPEFVGQMIIIDAEDVAAIKEKVDFVFCAVNMDKQETKELELKYAQAEIPVVSNNSAHRMTADVPMVIPEINHQHLQVIEQQRKRLGTKKGFIAVKPNCSIQSYVPVLAALWQYEPKEVFVSTYQAVSGAGKTLAGWPEMTDNIIPYIGGEEEKSEQEPLKIFGRVSENGIENTDALTISAQCVRVPVEDGHLATFSVRFGQKPGKEEIVKALAEFKGLPQELELPSAPKQFIHYFTENDRPQTHLDRDLEKGMAVSAGRLREDNIFDYRFVGLSHNTLRGAAGGAVLIAELLKAQGYLK
ncbi:aspartate-semialdehyde dehydrogenase [Lachnospiraceae bacterium oral taxon 500]|nr:aspartate-semialdehyde dehydrogenase [Lachnospiraceae bacterium oral taxon 500]